MIACAELTIACCDEPQRRLTAKATESIDMPPRMVATRATYA